MKCRRAWVEPFELALKRPLQIGTARIQSRRGGYLHLVDEQGTHVRGECAPLPGLHRETPEEAASQLNRVAATCQGRDLPAEGVGDAFGNLLPSVHFSLTMARQEWLWLTTPASQGPPARGVVLNALLMAADRDLSEEVERRLREGYRSIKLKVGRQPLESDVIAVSRIGRLLTGRASLRLDANRSWSLDDACRFGNALDPTTIDYIEEPLRDPRELTDFSRQTGLRVALDETLAESPLCESAVGEAVSALVIKPALLGALDHTLHLLRLARRRGLDAVLSSVFETPVALRFYARLAHAHAISSIPHGLDTWRCFADDGALDPIVVANGQMTWTDHG